MLRSWLSFCSYMACADSLDQSLTKYPHYVRSHKIPEGPSTQYLGTLVPKEMPVMWFLGPECLILLNLLGPWALKE